MHKNEEKSSYNKQLILQTFYITLYYITIEVIIIISVFIVKTLCWFKIIASFHLCRTLYVLLLS